MGSRSPGRDFTYRGTVVPEIPLPPSALTGPLGEYLRMIARAISDTPQISVFSGPTPNSVVSGYPGDVAINLSSSAATRLWVMEGSARVPSLTGWVSIRTA